MSEKIKALLHEKRAATEAHIRQLEAAGTQGVRYTAIIPDMSFLVLGLLCDAGGIVQLVAETVYCLKNGAAFAADWLALIAAAGVVVGNGFTVWLNMLHEKEIATRFQKNMSFGLTVFSGLAGELAAILQMALHSGASAPLLSAAAGGLLNFAAGLPIFLSFKKGIIYGIR